MTVKKNLNIFKTLYWRVEKSWSRLVSTVETPQAYMCWKKELEYFWRGEWICNECGHFFFFSIFVFPPCVFVCICVLVCLCRMFSVTVYLFVSLSLSVFACLVLILLCLMFNLKSICLSMLITYLRLLVCLAVFVCPKTPIN